jgi:lipoprotein-releasing system permease protein
MDALGARIWEWAGAAGGTLALAFIVALALGLFALAAMFIGAAVVVLERFARQARRVTSIVIAATVVAFGVAFVALQTEVPGVLERGDALARALPLAIGSGLVLVGLAVAVVALALRLATGRTLGRIALGVLTLGVAFAIPLPPLAWLDLTARSAVSAAGFGLLGVLAAAVALGLAPLALAGFLDLRGSAEWFIAARYLVAKRRQTFISVITGICIAGVAAGVWLIITVLSVMNGFERTWREEIIGNRAHFTVQSGLGPFDDYDQILARVLEAPGVVAGSPFVQAEGMVRGRDGEIVGVRLQGVDPARVGDVTQIREDLIEGSLEAVARGEPGPPPESLDEPARANPDDPGIVIGDDLANAFGLHLGDPLLLISPFGGPLTPLGASPRLMRFRVAGVFRSSAFQGEEVVTYTSLEAAQEFKRSGDVVDGIEVRTSDYYRSARIAEGAQLALGFPFYTRDWKEFFPAFFQALKTERVMMFVLLTMIMVVAAFAIVVTLIMMIMEKASDIAILKAMGARDAAIERIFAIEGALIGLTGTVIGVVTGIAVTTRLDWIQHRVEDLTGIDALPATVYQGISELPAQLDAVQIAAVVGIAMALALGGTWIPSRQGARLDPVEALRYE